MNTPLISVIVPIYNVEKYLKRCVESVVNQSYNNLEIILVDDGSPDNCPKMCDEYAKKDSRIIVVHKQNGGLSSARNAGLDVAKGDFITFLDSDDYIDTDAYENMMNDIMKYNAEIVSCGMVRESPNGYTEKWGNGELIIHDRRDAKKHIIRADGLLSVHSSNKIYNRCIIKNARFDTSLRFAEDIMFIFSIIDNVNVWVEHNVIYYHYTNNATSLTKKAFAETRFDEHIVSDRIIDSVKDDEELYKIAVAGDIYKVFRTIKQMCVSQNCMDRFFEMRNRIIKHKNDILFSDLYDYSTKVKTVILFCFPTLYKMLIRIYGRYTDNKYAQLTGMG